MARAFPGQVQAIFIRDVVGLCDTSPLLSDEALLELSKKPPEPQRPKSPEVLEAEKKPKEDDTRPADVKLAERLQNAFHGLDYKYWKIFTDPLKIRNDPQVVSLLQ
jgi:hypothetical protein